MDFHDLSRCVSIFPKAILVLPLYFLNFGFYVHMTLLLIKIEDWFGFFV